MRTITTALLTSNRSIRSGIGNSIDPTGFIVRPYISDIHNGISNPNFTYTGGQAIVPDENGILRRTPAGYPAVEGGRWAATVAEGALLGPELCESPNDISQLSGTNWRIQVSGTVISPTEFHFGGQYSNIVQFTPTVVGNKYLLKFKARWLSGNTALSFLTEGPAEAGPIPITVTDELQEYSRVVTAINSGFVFGIQDRNVAGHGNVFITDASIKEIIPQWLPPTAGTTRSISTRKGLRTIQTSDAFLGMLTEQAMTNKCTCRKSNPTDVTGLTGAGGAVPTLVSDTAALAAKYADICTTGNVYNLSIPQNGTINMAGAVANLNKHSVSLDMRLVSGIGVQLGLTGQTSDVTLTAAYSRQKKEGLTPLNAADVITITNLNADTAVVRCILPGLEENAFCTSRIAPAADTAASQVRSGSVTSASTSGVFPSTGQDFAIFMRVVPDNDLMTTPRNLFSIGGVGYYIVISASPSNKPRIAFYINPSAAEAYGNTLFIKDAPLDIAAIKTMHGMSIKSRIYAAGAWGAWSSWGSVTTEFAKIPSIVSPLYFIGCGSAGTGQSMSNHPRTAIISMPPKATLAEYQAWIETELTLRGLI